MHVHTRRIKQLSFPCCAKRHLRLTHSHRPVPDVWILDKLKQTDPVWKCTKYLNTVLGKIKALNYSDFNPTTGIYSALILLSLVGHCSLAEEI